MNKIEHSHWNWDEKVKRVVRMICEEFTTYEIIQWWKKWFTTVQCTAKNWRNINFWMTTVSCWNTKIKFSIKSLKQKISAFTFTLTLVFLWKNPQFRVSIQVICNIINNGKIQIRACPESLKGLKNTKIFYVCI